MSFVLDTNISSAWMKGHAAVSNRFVQYGGRLYVSAVTLGELWAWGGRANTPSRRLQRLLDLLKDVHVLPVDDAVARKFGDVRAWQLDRGLATPGLDLLNGSVALLHDFTLVTHNTQPRLHQHSWLENSTIGSFPNLTCRIARMHSKGRCCMLDPTCAEASVLRLRDS